MRSFEIFDQMNEADEVNKTSLLSVSLHIVEAKTAKGGGHVKMGVPAEVITQILTGDRQVILLVFDKKEFDRIDKLSQPTTNAQD